MRRRVRDDLAGSTVTPLRALVVRDLARPVCRKRAAAVQTSAAFLYFVHADVLTQRCGISCLDGKIRGDAR